MSPLDPGRWARLEPLLDRLLAEEPAARPALLDWLEHDVAARTQRVIHLKDGRVEADP